MTDWAAQGGYAAAYSKASGSPGTMTPFHSINTLKGTMFIGGAMSQSIINKARAAGARTSDFGQAFLAEAAPSPGTASTYTPSAATAKIFSAAENEQTTGGGGFPNIYALLIPAAILYLATRKR